MTINSWIPEPVETHVVGTHLGSDIRENKALIQENYNRIIHI